MSNKITRNELHVDIVKKIDDSATKLELQSVSDSLTSVTGSVSTHVADQNAHGIASKVATLNSQIESLNSKLLAHEAKAISDGAHNTISTGNLIYYVRTDGNNANSGLSDNSAGAFRTIQYAINKIPQIVNHTITIRAAAGNYSEVVTLESRTGRGDIQIYGSGKTDCIITKVSIVSCDLRVIFSAFKLTEGSSGYPLFISRCTDVASNNLDITLYGSTSGIRVEKSYGTLYNCTISNRGGAITAEQVATLISDSNTGSNNGIGLQADSAGVIIKVGSQPTGTTNESASRGGIIRS